MTLPSGKIPIEQVAERVGRSVDLVASRLLADLANPADLLDRIILPTVASKALFAKRTCAASSARRADPTDRVTEQGRSDEHTYEIQSLLRMLYAVFCLKKTTNDHYLTIHLT